MPFCSDYAGTGAIPDGYELLIFDRDASLPTSPLYPDGRATRTDDGKGWVAKAVSLGDKPPATDGLTVDLFAVLVTDDVARTLDNLVIVLVGPAENTHGVWKLQQPPGIVKDTMRVTRGGDPGRCG